MDGSPNGFRVKQLEWENAGHSWLAKADTGTYRAHAPNGGAYFMWLRYSDWPRSGVILGMEGEMFDSAFADIDGAKAAAQADYERRILSALEPAK